MNEIARRPCLWSISGPSLARVGLVMLVLAATAAPSARAHSSGTSADPPDDGHLRIDYSGTGSDRIWFLRTRDDRPPVHVRLVASTGATTIHVRISDPDGRAIADLDGHGELDVDSGSIRVVDRPVDKSEARPGTWRIDVTTTSGEGHYELRWWGLYPPTKDSGEAGHL